MCSSDLFLDFDKILLGISTLLGDQVRIFPGQIKAYEPSGYTKSTKLFVWEEG